MAQGDLTARYPDLVCGNMFSVNISIFYNNRDGTFKDAQTIASDPGPMFPVVTDLNNDGRLDIAVCNIGHDDISIYFNRGGGVFERKKTLPCKGVVPYSLITADFDGDGPTT